jgi:hypothetical protein
MKRYEEYVGQRVNWSVNPIGYAKWLEAQLTWRPVSEKPEKADMYFAEVRPYTGCESTIITTAYFDGERFPWHDVVKWLPIPPAPEVI